MVNMTGYVRSKECSNFPEGTGDFYLVVTHSQHKINGGERAQPDMPSVQRDHG